MDEDTVEDTVEDAVKGTVNNTVIDAVDKSVEDTDTMHLACCFTGYRPEKYKFDIDGDSSDATVLKVKPARYVNELISKGVTEFYCGCARGFDIFAAEAVLEAKKYHPTTKLISVMPFRDMNRGWEPGWTDRLMRVLDQSDDVIVIADGYRRGVYDIRNRYMVDHSEYVITYFDGAVGGTRNTLDYAKRKNRVVVNLADEEPLHPKVPDRYPVFVAEKLPFC